MKRSLFWLLDQYLDTGESVTAVHATALAQATEADSLGFDSLWLAEHHFWTLGSVPNPAVLLAAMAQRTGRLRLGTATVVLPMRSPIHVAEDYAMVDALSGGRLNLGVGSGSVAKEFAPFGVDYEQRRELYMQSLATIRKRWHAAASGEVGTDSLNVAPVQASAPIYVATMNEDSALHIGRAGDGMLTLVPPTAKCLTEPLARLRSHARGMQDAQHLGKHAQSVMMMFAHVAKTEAEVRATVVPALARLMCAMTGAEWPDPEALYEQMRSGDVGIFGTPAEAAKQLERLEQQGVGHVAFVSRFGGMPSNVAARSLRHLSR